MGHIGMYPIFQSGNALFQLNGEQNKIALFAPLLGPIVLERGKEEAGESERGSIKGRDKDESVTVSIIKRKGPGKGREKGKEGG